MTDRPFPLADDYNRLLLAFTSRPDADTASALLGKSRIAGILLNVAVPILAAEGMLPDASLGYQPPEEFSAPLCIKAFYLLGRDYNPVHYVDSGLLQQGLLDIYFDFCLNAKPDCGTCGLSDALGREDLQTTPQKERP